MIQKMMKILGKFEWSLQLGVNAAGFALFALFYGIVYWVTSEVYFRIV